MIILLIILDGCAINSFIEAQTPFLDSFGENKYRTFNCKAVFPTATYTGHSSILTGNYPEKHGLIGNQFFDRNDKKIKHFDYYNPSQHIESKTLFEIFSSLQTMAIAEPIIKGASFVFPMNKLNEIPLEERNNIIFEKTLNTIKEHNIKFGVINFAGIDGYGEIYGPNDKKYYNELSKVDQYISEIYDSINQKLILIITADHGMTKISKHFNLNTYFEKKGFKIHCLASHRTSHLYFKGKSEIILEELKQLKELDRVFLKSQTREIKLFHDRTGDIVVSANREIELEKENLKGSHGGFLKEEIYVPLFLISKNFELKYNLDSTTRTFSIVDIAPTIVKLSGMKIKPDFQGYII